MSQLITATVKNFEAVHFKQNARLVSDVNLDSVRQKALARQRAFKMQNSIHNTTADTEYITQVRNAFSEASTQTVSNTQPAQTVPAVSGTSQAAQATNEAVQTTAQVQQAVQAAYTQDRGSFEKRVATGEVSYVPALEMTVITQLPSVEFEYLGGFNYVPPSSAPDGEHVNKTL